MNKKITVTQPFLPPLEEYLPYLQRIWENKHITNNGPFHQQLEEKLCDYLGVKHLSLFANGTSALLVAIKALELTGEIITTPYSFVASSHTIKWNGINQPTGLYLIKVNYNQEIKTEKIMLVK